MYVLVAWSNVARGFWDPELSNLAHISTLRTPQTGGHSVEGRPDISAERNSNCSKISAFGARFLRESLRGPPQIPIKISSFGADSLRETLRAPSKFDRRVPRGLRNYF